MSRDLTKYEFEGLVQQITDMYRDKPGLGDGYDSSTGQVLIQLLADVTDNLHYMLERRSQEAYTATARLRSSVWAAVSGAGYRPRRRVSATGELRVELLDTDGNPKPAAGNIFIPYGKRVGFDGREFIANADYTIPQGATSIDIQVKEGRLEERLLNFQDEPFLSDNYFTIDEYEDIEEFSLNIVGNNKVFKDVFEFDGGLRVRAISFADSDMPVYDVKYFRNGMRVVFGDGTFGLKPSGNLLTNWVVSSGDNVNVANTGVTFSFDEEILYDDVIVTPKNEYLYRMTNITPIRGGRESESLEDIRENVTAFVRSNDRAVTNFDYTFWIRRSGIGDMADVKVYGEQEANRLIFSMNNVFVSYATNDGLELNPIQIEQLRAYIDRLKVNTTHIVFRPVDRIHLGLDISFKRHPSLPISNSQLYRVVVERVNDYFKVERGSIGKEFQHSEFVEYLQNLTFQFNNIIYPMTDFVKVKATGMVGFDIPQPSYDGIIEVDATYAITSNDVWNVTIDDQTFTVVTTSSDSISTMVDKMQEEIFKGTSLMMARPAYNQIRIKHPLDTGVFTVSVGTGDLTNVTIFKQFIQIPRPTNRFNPNINQILPESVGMVDTNGNVLMKDNGTGLLIDESGGYASIVIDYSDCKFQNPSIPADTYYLMFQQNAFQNFDITDEGIIDVMPFRSMDDESTTHFFSTLTLL
jgi:hypothetical protein